MDNKILYKDRFLPIEDRIDDLLSRMTLDEKFNELDPDLIDIDWTKIDESDKEYCLKRLKTRSGDAKTHNILQKYAKEHTRLGIPFLIHEEALHGLIRPGCTIFPQQMNLAQTFEPKLAYDMGRCIATEARARGIHETWNPVLDLARDPRWGRTEETFGEDTYLSAQMGARVVDGLQGNDLQATDTVAAELKHYTGYGNPIGGLNCAPTTMGRHDVHAYCMPVFEEAFVESGAINTMCSYNSIDGVPVVSDHDILTETLRNKWGMRGFVRADMTAIIMQHTAHMTAATPKEALLKAVKAGVDVQLYDYSASDLRKYYRELLDDGDITIDDIDQSVRRVLRVKFMLGLFENPFVDEGLQEKVTRCTHHLNTALKIARKSVVLLKNKDGMLPLDKDIKRIAVVGPNADKAVLGDYSVNPSGFEPITLLDGVKELVSPETEITYAKGCNILGSEIKPIPRWWMKTIPTATFDRSDYGFTAEYFNGADFSGEPVLVRLDKQIDFNWIYSKPDDRIDTNCFCVRWTGKMRVEKSFSGRIGLSSQDSMRLYVDGRLLVDGWESRDANVMVPFAFEAGIVYDIRVEFRNDARGARVVFGYDHGEESIDKAVEAVKNADVAIVALGDSEETSGENFDRTTLDLPGRQLDFLKELHATGTPIVLVVYTGRAASLTWEDENIPAILQAGFPGEKGGQAIAEILFGDAYPSGRLTMSYPRTVGQIPCHYSRKPAGGRQYVEMDWNPLYPFGYGLTYTKFEYSKLSLSAKSIKPDESIAVTFDVTNVGREYGEEVVQVYVNDCFSSVVKPIKELKGFEKVQLDAGETQTVTIELGFKALRTLNANYEWVVEPGEFEVYVGDNAGNTILQDSFTVEE